METEENELFQNEKKKSWRKWFKYNVRYSSEDHFLLIKYMLTKMKRKNNRLYKEVFSSEKFILKICEETKDIAGMAYFYNKTSKNLDLDQSFTEILKTKIECQKEEVNFKDFVSKFFFCSDQYFQNIGNISKTLLNALNTKIIYVMNTLESENLSKIFETRDFILTQVNFSQNKTNY